MLRPLRPNAAGSVPGNFAGGDAGKPSKRRRFAERALGVLAVNQAIATAGLREKREDAPLSSDEAQHFAFRSILLSLRISLLTFRDSGGWEGSGFRV